MTTGTTTIANTLKTTVLLAALFGLFILIGRWLGGVNGMVIGFPLAEQTLAEQVPKQAAEMLPLSSALADRPLL